MTTLQIGSLLWSAQYFALAETRTLTATDWQPSGFDRPCLQKELSLSRVLVGTAEVFRRALVDTGFLHPTHFSLVVLDECHNAVGNSPMVGMLTDSITRVDRQHQPRILGLTASFANGSLKNLQTKRAKMEALLMANIISPAPTAADASTGASSDNDEESSHGSSGADGSGKRFFSIPIPSEDLDYCYADVTATATAALANAPPSLIPRSELRKWAERGWFVFSALGWEGFRFWLREGVVMGLRVQAEELSMRPEANNKQKGAAMKEGLTRLAEMLKQSAAGASAFEIIAMAGEEVHRGLPSQPPYFSQKVLCLVSLLQQLRAGAPQHNQVAVGAHSVANARDEPRQPDQEAFRGLVFVERTSMTYPLAFLINKFLANGSGQGAAPAGLSMLPVSGAGTMCDSVRNENLDAFRRGSVPLLVCTAALEEGIDVPQCSFVIRFDKFNTTKAHIQGSGRARSFGANVYYFENDQVQECGQAAYLRSVAGDTSLNLTPEQMEAQRQARLHLTERTLLTADNLQFVYPYKGAGGVDGEVNFFNCMTIVYEYVQAVMRQSFDPEDNLFQVREDAVRSLPHETSKVILSVTWPTPRGVQVTNAELIHRMWAGRTVESVVRAPERTKKMSGWDKDKRRALYVVVLQMHALGLLDAANHATPGARALCKLACPAYHMPDRLSVNVSFSKASLYQ
eukprot:jgi/Mesvir1/23858/Mv10657-RA.6